MFSESELHWPGNTKGGSITVPLTSCLTGLESAVWLLTKPVKQEVNSTVILPLLVFPALTNDAITALWNPQWSNCPSNIKFDHFNKVALSLVKFFLSDSQTSIFKCSQTNFCLRLCGGAAWVHSPGRRVGYRYDVKFCWHTEV
jgi:hypothetical protein